MTIKKIKRFSLGLLIVLFIFQSVNFAQSPPIGDKLKNTEVIKQEMQKAMAKNKMLRIDIRTHLDLIRERIDRTRRSIKGLIRDPKKLSDDDINALKTMAADLEATHKTIKTGIAAIRDSQALLKEAIEQKDRKGTLAQYRIVIQAQVSLLASLKTMNETLIGDMEKLLALKSNP